MPGTDAPADLLDRLVRAPYDERPDLVAVDATDRYLLDEAAPLVDDRPGSLDGVVVVGDRHGALTIGAVALLGATEVRVHQDALLGERSLELNASRSSVVDGSYAHHGLDPELVRDARLVLLQLPRSLDALREVAELVAAHAHPDVVLLAGGRVKHMTTAMNDVLAASFGEVRASLARQKSRLLVARGPRPDVVGTYPRSAPDAGLGLVVVAHGAAFAGARVDHATRLLATHLAGAVPSARTAVDLGCGTGVLAVVLARARPGLEVVAADDSAAAVASSVATAAANGVSDRVRVVRDDAGDSLPSGSVDLVVCNPPFHLGAVVDEHAGDRLFAGAARLLRPGGELWTVWNTAIDHRPTLGRVVGPTRVITRDRRYTVAASRRR